jgi:hypothetical protein
MVGGWIYSLPLAKRVTWGMGFRWARGKWTAGVIHGSPSVISVPPPLQQHVERTKQHLWSGWTWEARNDGSHGEPQVAVSASGTNDCCPNTWSRFEGYQRVYAVVGILVTAGLLGTRLRERR